MSELPYKTTLALPVFPTDELLRLEDYFDPHLIPDHQRLPARTGQPPQGKEFLLRIGKEVIRPYWGSCRYLRAKRGYQGTTPIAHAAGESIGEVC
jgi:hypothetical protein